jgi:hypothetical protein
MVKAIVTLATVVLVAGLQSFPAAAQDELFLTESPPDRYVVVKGDTLWGISARFLRDPWRWPDIWGLNRDQIRNPHWIYPGDVIVLDFSGTTPRLRLEGDADWQLLTARLSPRIRTEGLPPSAIPSIPAASLQAFVTRPLIVGEYELANAARIIATQENRVVLGAGDIAFVRGLVWDHGAEYKVVRPGKTFIDPDTREVLGYEAVYLGEAQVREFGEISTVQITSAVREMAPGDRLVYAPPTTAMPYMPHAPSGMVRGRIIAPAAESVSEIGPLQVVVLNRGSREGLETGHVLALYRSRPPVRPADSTDRRERVNLPDERYGVVFVFRVFDRVSYALVMNSTRPVNVLDSVQTP